MIRRRIRSVWWRRWALVVVGQIMLATPLWATQCCALPPPPPEPPAANLIPDVSGPAGNQQGAGLPQPGGQDDGGPSARRGDAPVSSSERAVRSARAYRRPPARPTADPRVYTSLFISSRPTERLELAAALDFPIRAPQLYATVRVNDESRYVPSLVVGAINMLAVNDYNTVGLFAPSHTSPWAVISKGVFTRYRLRFSVGGMRTWYDGKVHALSTVRLTVHPRLRLHTTYFAGTFYPGVSAQVSQGLWLQGSYLMDRRAVALRAQWRAPSSFDF